MSDPSVVERYRRAGWWDGTTIADLVADSFAARPDARVIVHSADRPFRGTYADVLTAAQRLAGALRDRGVGVGDAVAFQVPNWAESLSCFVAISLLGATLVPIAPYYGRRELEWIVQSSGARVLVVATTVRGRDHLEVVDHVRRRAASLDTVVTIGAGPRPSWAVDFGDLVTDGVPVRPAAVDPGSDAAIAWTSGTGSDPKGVRLSHQALAFEVRHHMSPSLPRGRPRLCGAPLAHVTGMLAAALVPAYRGEDIHLTDAWNPPDVLTALVKDGIAPGLYSPVFATTLLAEPTLGDAHRALMETASLGGAPVPLGLVHDLENQGIAVTRGYGCTEHPSISLSRAQDPAPHRLETDGPVLPGVEVRLIDDDGRAVSPGEPGEILTRGPDLFTGYLDAPADAPGLDTAGWFHTGDVGTLAEENGRRWLSIVDRKKDLIIRAGVNISPAEVEMALLTMPGVVEAAVVAVTDQRLGERACVVVRPEPSTPAPTLDDIRGHLAAAGLARQKWPERLVVHRDAFPRTPSGKVRKRDLPRP